MRFKIFLSVLAAGFLGVITAGAASASSMFVVMDNHGALVTKASLTQGELIAHDGIAYRVVLVHPLSSGVEEIILAPRLPASDSGPLTFAPAN
jgi:hypothetical protein